LVDALVAVRRRHPRWGAKKLLAVAHRQDPSAAWPKGVEKARRRDLNSD
jgi:hypothetical protein